MEKPSFFCLESRVENNQNIYGRFQLAPFIPGHAVTLVNGLRRCLLSEIYGIAITAVEIKGVEHEYSTIAGVRESVLDILLNVRQIVLASEFKFQQPQVAFLQVQGPGIVRASDIKLPISIQNVKPEQYIATILYDGVLNMKFMICRGKNSLVQTPRGLKSPKLLKPRLSHQIKTKRNYMKFNVYLKKYANLYKDLDERSVGRYEAFQKNTARIVGHFIIPPNRLGKNKHKKSKNDIFKQSRIEKKKTAKTRNSFLPIDAVFAPVFRVNFAIENNDLSNTPKERVILEIWTNGSIHPIQAIVEAGRAFTKITYLLEGITNRNTIFINSPESFKKMLRYDKVMKKVKNINSINKGRQNLFYITAASLLDSENIDTVAVEKSDNGNEDSETKNFLLPDLTEEISEMKEELKEVLPDLTEELGEISEISKMEELLPGEKGRGLDYLLKTNYSKMDIGNLDLSLRPYTCLKQAKIENVGDLLQNSAEDLLNLKNFGKHSLNEVENSLNRLKLKLSSQQTFQ